MWNKQGPFAIAVPMLSLCIRLYSLHVPGAATSYLYVLPVPERLALPVHGIRSEDSVAEEAALQFRAEGDRAR